MKYTLQDRLLRRELGEQSTYSGIKGLYGDKKWAQDLDIVNELGGHYGCVNALRSVDCCPLHKLGSRILPATFCVTVLTIMIQLVQIRYTPCLWFR